MKPWDTYCLKTVRWSGWLLLLIVLFFFLTGYIMSGRFELDRLLDEKTALALHKLLHMPLMLLMVVHTVPAVYLAMQRWGWLKRS
ncbi:MAG TPA: hypothetical protein P5186_14585 [Candidatus Paceibacterota bacterium]|nr:hypothetical protein [Verrucomicrobiota bacterium]HRY49273.1 hypothetical protein [Candidatus Paceibacterota bacterium]HSA01505.1 hypothetical protein [Candidatus Paceibacterota bacterium]